MSNPYADKGYGYDQPVTPMMNVQNSTTVVQQPMVSGGGTNIVMVQQQLRPASYIGLSIFTCLCCNPLFGLIALIFAIMSSSESDAGNLETGRTHGRVALWMNVAGIIIGIGVGIFLIVWFVVVVKNADDCINDPYNC